jgi:hypothetical protein
VGGPIRFSAVDRTLYPHQGRSYDSGIRLAQLPWASLEPLFAGVWWIQPGTLWKWSVHALVLFRAPTLPLRLIEEIALVAAIAVFVLFLHFAPFTYPF